MELGEKNMVMVVEQGQNRMTVMSTVSQAGVCQSLLMGEILLAVPTGATMLGWRELEENRERVITMHRELSTSKNCLLLSSSNQMYFMAPCLTSTATFLLAKLATAEVLLPLPDLSMALGTVENEDKRMLGMLRELEHQSIFNPLDYNMGKLDSAWEIVASSRQVLGEKLVGQRGSRGRGDGGRGRGRGRGSRGKLPVVHIV